MDSFRFPLVRVGLLCFLLIPGLFEPALKLRELGDVTSPNVCCCRQTR